VDMAIDLEVIRRKGSWLAYKGENLGQGKEKVSKYLLETPALMEEIKKEILEKAGQGDALLVPRSPAAEPAAGEAKMPEPVVEEELLELEEEDL